MNDAAAAAADAERVRALQQKYALSYHIPFAMLADRLVGLRGKQVLEVGGSLPDGLVLGELDARGWLAVEQMDYWDETLSTGHVLGTPPTASAAPLRLRDADLSALLGHRVCHGGIEDLPPTLEACFDVVFSIAAFEHIGRLPLALERMHAALRPGGRLFALFSPIWSAYDGHHLPEIEDAAGRHYNFSRSPIPPWGHLLMRPMELFDHLLAEGVDRATAQQIVYFVHHSGHINRLFLDDHLQIAERCPLRMLLASRLFPRPVPPQVQQRLEVMFPGCRDFCHNGLLLVLERPAAAN
jgi:SAM-dependent methyltransferase